MKKKAQLQLKLASEVSDNKNKKLRTGYPRLSLGANSVQCFFIKDVDSGAECILGKYADDTTLGGATDSFQGWEALQRDLEGLEHWVMNNI